MNKSDFQEIVWQKGRALFRPMPWRDNTDPYYVLVSELMLQQTQVSRVIPKFEAFMERFPDVYALASADLSEVLSAWQGLGYNRRAQYLHRAARMVVEEFQGLFPSTDKQLQQLPGVGPNTAGAIRAYAFNQPSIFIETNIRTIYFYHYFDAQEAVSDTEVRQALEQTIDQEHPREWYWALMDYGSFLKRQGVRNNAQSKHYTKQSPLEGSARQVRGQIIAALVHTNRQTEGELRQAVQADARFSSALAGLLSEGLVQRSGERVQLGSAGKE